jgi:hypothetical protein
MWSTGGSKLPESPDSSARVTELRVVVRREAITTEPYWLQRVMFNTPGIVRFRMVSVEEVLVGTDYKEGSFEFEKTNRGPNREDVYIDEETVNIPTVTPPGPPPQDEDPPLPELVPDLSGPAMSDRLQHHLIHHAGFPPIVALGVMIELFAEAMTEALDEFEQETGHRGMITVVAKEGRDPGAGRQALPLRPGAPRPVRRVGCSPTRACG